MDIRDVMTPNPRCVSASAPLREVAQVMRDEDTGAVPIVDNGRPIGIITDRDIVLRAVAEGNIQRQARDLATGDLVTISPDTSTKEAADLMARHQVRRLPVVEQERIVGIVSLGDLAVREGKESRMGETLEEISKK
jgi:CBS domain-containing protein